MVSGDRLLQIIERHDQALRGVEDSTLDRINAALEQSYKSLERQLNKAYQQHSGNTTLLPTQRKLIILDQVSSYLQLINTRQAESLQADLEAMLRGGDREGQSMADDLAVAIADEGLKSFASVPIAAVRYQAEEGINRLRRHSEDFRSRASAIVEQGLIQGWAAAKVASNLRQELGATKQKAEVIARTETLAAHNSAIQANLQKNGYEAFQFFATQDDRLCSFCAARNQQVYKLGESRPPIHPNCRCVAVPWRREWVDEGLLDVAWSANFREEGLAELEAAGGSPNFGASPFERMASKSAIAPEPIWIPPTVAELKRQASQKPAATTSGSSTTEPPPAPVRAANGTPVALLKLEDRIRLQRFESLAAFDENGKELFFQDGEEFEVGVTQDQLRLMKGQYVTHNHPRGWGFPETDPQHAGNSFSKEDLNLACVAEVAELRAVAVGHRYSIKPPEGGWSAEYHDRILKPEYKRQDAQVRREWQNMIDSAYSRSRADGDRAVALANSQHAHLVVSRTAAALGIPYTKEVYEPWQ